MAISLYTYWRSSSAYRVRIALGAKGIGYEPVFVNLLQGQHKTDDYKATANPMGYVPCLEIDGAKYVESTAIVELLEDLYPEPPLYPKSAEDRARVRALVQYINAGTQPLQNLAVLEYLSPDHEVRKTWLRHFITRGLDAFEMLASRYGEGRFSFGDRFGAADVFLIPQLYNARRYQIDLAPYPRISRIEQACTELAFVKAAHPDVQPDAERSVLGARPGER
jgi:maleylpyruvate isomerase